MPDAKGTPQPSDVLLEALKVGDTMDLFSVFKDWPTEKLQALLRDIEVFTAQTYVAIDQAWKGSIFTPAAFFSPRASKAADKLRDEKKLNVMAVMSEICSVAIFYLNERGASTE